ncbi:hypothetical protein LEP1GSC199_1695 [Leptospira vanthielii serovar Holland str. Waz Holland = ATCC 700522]|uniref:Uncharacterized protein n=1 Tax=Leptospira vanthielii serovar Holland str. Waz Holland = ATCC 700522 TaxID=1218591 RepID=N1W6G7_9LEPT|nr:hypothetical protein LEP1GSC199_1695 [Leptospira vanthielii serovar Holland str. Waz Holland = ATCC 700522]
MLDNLLYFFSEWDVKDWSRSLLFFEESNSKFKFFFNLIVFSNFIYKK